MKNFRTYDLAASFYRQAGSLEVAWHLRDQLLRAASSVALNLAEGRGRTTRPDQVRFFTIALGSLRECQAILDLQALTHTEAAEIADKLGASLYRLIQNAR